MNAQLEAQVRNKLNLQSAPAADLAIILGSGLNCNFAFKNSHTLKYSELEGFPQAQIQGHKGLVTYGELSNGAKVLIFAGRFHLYEGYSVAEVQTIIKLIESLGIKNLLITNAAGGITDDLQVADLMLIEAVKDYQNDGNLLTERGLLDCLTKTPLKVESELSEFLALQNLKKGSYAAVLGPNYETHAEINLFKEQGCKAVGMSTYLELKLALEKGLNVAAISVITNSWCSKETPSHDEVLHNSSQGQAQLDSIIGSTLKHILSQTQYKFNPSMN